MVFKIKKRISLRKGKRTFSLKFLLIKWKNQINNWLFKDERKFYTLALFICFLIVLSLDFWVYKKGNFDENFLIGILTEAHGMLMDLFVLGILFSFYNHRRSIKEEITKYQNEIDDFREWQSEEATFRIVGNIRRLNKENVFNLQLSKCFLSNGKLDKVNLEESFCMKTIFSGASLDHSNFKKAFLKKAEFNNVTGRLVTFDGAELRNVSFRKAKLTGSTFINSFCIECIFDYANVFQVEFDKCDLTNTTFYKSNLFDASFKDAVLDKTNFSNSNLLNANFSKCNLIGCNFELAYVENVDFDNAIVDKESWINDYLSFAQKTSSIDKTVYEILGVGNTIEIDKNKIISSWQWVIDNYSVMTNPNQILNNEPTFILKKST